MFSRGKIFPQARSGKEKFHNFTGWTTAFVSPVIDAQSRSPTVMHALLYWLGSALRAPGGFVQPVEVGVEYHH